MVGYRNQGMIDACQTVGQRWLQNHLRRPSLKLNRQQRDNSRKVAHDACEHCRGFIINRYLLAITLSWHYIAWLNRNRSECFCEVLVDLVLSRTTAIRDKVRHWLFNEKNQ